MIFLNKTNVVFFSNSISILISFSYSLLFLNDKITHNYHLFIYFSPSIFKLIQLNQSIQLN